MQNLKNKGIMRNPNTPFVFPLSYLILVVLLDPVKAHSPYTLENAVLS